MRPNRYFRSPPRLDRIGILLPKFARIKRILRSFFILTVFWTAYSHALDLRYAQAKTPSFPDIKSAVDYLRELGVEVPAVQTAEKVFVGRFINGARRIYCEPLATNFQNNLIFLGQKAAQK